MKIQIIDNRAIFDLRASSDEVAISPFNDIHAFDAYDVTVVDLQDPNMWCSDHSNDNALLCNQDIKSVSQAIKVSKKSKILILLPQNSTYLFDWIKPLGEQPRYRQSCKLKDIIPLSMKKMLIGIMPESINLIPGKSKTLIKEQYFDSDFSLILNEAIKSDEYLFSDAETITAVSFSVKAYSTIKISNYSELRMLISAVFPERQDVFIAPEWLRDIQFLDEALIQNSISELDDRIHQLEKQKNSNLLTLIDYEKRKSILCTKGQMLQETVVAMLQELLGDEKPFLDINEEDYRFETKDTVFVFEIKGSKGGLTRKNLSDTDGHVQINKDELEANGDKREIKGCLIFAEQIETIPSNRDSYPEKQLILAKQYRLALIPTQSFLKLYEKFFNGRLNAEGFLQIIKMSDGLIDSDE